MDNLSLYITLGAILFSVLITFVVLKNVGVIGGAGKRREAERLIQTGSKARATIMAIQPTGTVVNYINIQCVVNFTLQPLSGGAPINAQKKMLIPQTSMPRLGDVWPCWYDATNPTSFAVGMPTALTPDQIALYKEFGIPHPMAPAQ